MTTSNYPPRIGEHDQVVLFDGVCKLCNFWVSFLIRYDKHRKYKLATVQSQQGKDILAWCGLPTDQYDTVVFVQGNRFYVRSTAGIRVMAGLPFPWKLVALTWFIPRPVRDWLYDRVAKNRYSLFGKYDACVVPSADNLRRFLTEQ